MALSRVFTSLARPLLAGLNNSTVVGPQARRVFYQESSTVVGPPGKTVETPQATLDKKNRKLRKVDHVVLQMLKPIRQCTVMGPHANREFCQKMLKTDKTPQATGR